MDDMPDGMKKMFMRLFGQFMPSEQGSWVNVAKLSSEDILRKKNLDMNNRRLYSEHKVLMAKLAHVQATLDMTNTEFWDSIYRTYGIPSDLPYKVDSTGQVTKYVPPPPAENP